MEEGRVGDTRLQPGVPEVVLKQPISGVIVYDIKREGTQKTEMPTL